jgi:hypothetical protein
MTKVSKAKPLRMAKSQAPPVRDPKAKHICVKCGKEYNAQKGSFPVSRSPLFYGNGRYLPVCNVCIDDLFDHYANVTGDEAEAMQRLCMKFDIYWSYAIWDKVKKIPERHTKIRSYLSQTNLANNSGKTYDDSIDEAKKQAAEIEAQEKQERKEMLQAERDKMLASVNAAREKLEADKLKLEEDKAAAMEEVSNARNYMAMAPDEETLEFWGAGLPYEIYPALNARYKKWTSGIEGEIDKALEARYKQICILEETVNNNIASGKFPESSIKTLNDLIKEVQKTQVDTTDEAFDALPFGVGIKMCENTRPIPKPIPELEDHDGIVRYISIWFLGHLCKMLGIKNTYCKLYEDEMARLRVDRPDLEEEDDEGAFNEIFGESDES